MDQSITISTIIGVCAFFFGAITFLNKQKKQAQEDSARSTRLEGRIKTTKDELDELKEDFKEFKHEIKEDLNKLDTQVINRINLFDEKLDAIKNILIQKFS